jgi:hypothetical protein
MVVEREVRAARQAIAKLFNIELKNRSGAAVTIPELERLKEEYGKGVFKTAAQLGDAITQARTLVNSHYRSVAAGFSPEVLAAYNDNLTAVGGKPVIDITGKATAAPKPEAPKDEALPMPKAKAELVKGKKYQTARGVATWDGSNFVQ